LIPDLNNNGRIPLSARLIYGARGPEKKWSKVYTTEKLSLREIDVDKMSQDRNKSILKVTKWEILLSILQQQCGNKRRGYDTRAGCS